MQRRVTFQTTTGRLSFEYPAIKVRLDKFRLKTTPGNIHKGEILVILGENGLGKTTFAKELIGADSPAKVQTTLSYKPQVLDRSITGSVLEFLTNYMGRFPQSSQLKKFLLKPLNISHLLDKTLEELSGGYLVV